MVDVSPQPKLRVVAASLCGVWLSWTFRFLANRNPYAAELDELLVRDEVAGHDLIYGELLIGDPGGRQQFLAAYEMMSRVPAIRHSEVVEFVRSKRLYGQGVGWINAHLLASALVSDVPLWTVDERLSKLASALGIAYVPTA